MDDQQDPKVLESVDEGRRASLKKILLSAAFVVPVVASFTMSGLAGIKPCVNCSNVTTTNKTCGHQHQPPPQPVYKPLDPPHTKHK
jgi:hypothetical protein